MDREVWWAIVYGIAKSGVTNTLSFMGIPGGSVVICHSSGDVGSVQQVALVVKNPPANAGAIRGWGSIPVSGKCPGGRDGNPLQYSCLENPTDRGAWRATVHRVAKSRTRLK